MKFKRIYNLGPHGVIETEIEIPDDVWNKWVEHCKGMLTGTEPESEDIMQIMVPYDQLMLRCHIVSDSLRKTTSPKDERPIY